jgi:mycofactocin precursor
MADPATELLDPPAGVVAASTAEQERVEHEEVQPEQVIAADLLVEEISIDGMCGVY